MAKTSRLLFVLLIGCEANDAAVGTMDDAGAESPEEAAKMDASVGTLDAALDAKAAVSLDGTAATPTDARVAPTDASAPSVTLTAKVDSKEVWSASGFQVQAGRCYDLTAQIDDKWLDLDVPSDLSGWIDKQDPRLALFTPFRRVVQDDIAFYQFATCVNKELDQCYPVGAQTTLCPKTAGELFFFVNDAANFESNNVGTATLTFTAR